MRAAHPQQLALSEPPSRVARLTSRSPIAGGEHLVTAAQLAELLQVDRCWVYEHKEMLSARYLGDGPRARLRFSPTEAFAALTRSRDGATTRARRGRRRSSRSVPAQRTDAGNALLPLPGQAGC